VALHAAADANLPEIMDAAAYLLRKTGARGAAMKRARSAHASQLTNAVTCPAMVASARPGRPERRGGCLTGHLPRPVTRSGRDGCAVRGALVPGAMAIAGDFYGQGRRALALGIIGAVTEAGGVIGPLYGAIIVQQFGWQYIFFLNVPIVIGLMVGVWILIPKGTHLHEGIDWIGAILLGLALACLSLGLAQQGTELGPPSPNGTTPQNNPISLALALVFLIAFVLVERKVRWPVVDLSLFKRLPFSATSMVSLLVGAALIIAMADIPIFVDTVLQRPVLDSGLALLRLTAMIPIGALLGGWLCGRITCRFTAALGLLFTASGFYLMSRWPINVDWNQITISTMTAGLGFGLVIAPIGTTAINAVKATQAGMSSAIVTALRMVGMMLGLAALTSWALAYFKELAAQYPSLPATATADQFAQWSQGYAKHLIASAHTVYSAVFFTSMILCLIAILPALFLWGRKAPLAETVEAPNAPQTFPPADTPETSESTPETNVPQTFPPEPTVEETTPAEPDIHEAVTQPVPDDTPLASTAVFASDDMLQDPNLNVDGTPPTPPADSKDDDDGKGGRNLKRRRLIIAAISALLILLLVGVGVFAALTWQSPDDTTSSGLSSTATGTVPSNAATPTPIAGPRMIQLALDGGALTSLFVSQLGLQQGAITDISVVPTLNDGVVLSLNLHIDSNGIHRLMPIELDGVLGIDKYQNIQLHILHLKRDGLDAGPAAAANMESALNQMLMNSLMPALRDEL